MDKRYNIIFASIIVGGISLFILWALLPFRNAIFGAIILDVLFYPFYRWMHKKLGWKKGVAALIVILASLLIILIPMFSLMGLLIGEFGEVVQYRTVIVDNVNRFDSWFPNVDISEVVRLQLSKFSEWVSQALFNTVSGASNLALNLTIMYFILYYLLTNYDALASKLASFIPFNEKHSKRLIEEFSKVTYATVVTTGVIAAVQGILITVGFLIFGVKSAFLWGFVAAVLSFLPVVGPPVVWLPASAYLMFAGRYWAAGGLFVWGFIVSNIDNFIRPHLQKNIGNLHPVVSIVGVFIGIPYFGILGIIIGPLLLSYFLLLSQMFKEEYLS